MIALISAVPFEGPLVRKAIKKDKIQKSPEYIFGMLGSLRVVYMASGIEAANAARAVTILSERMKPDSIIYFGIGGAYPNSGLKMGDVALAETELYGDCGVITPEGFKGMQAIGFPLLKKGRKEFYNEFPSSPILLKKIKRHFPELKTGRFVTVCAGTRTPGRAVILENRHGGIVEDMEGAAASHTALYYGIPFIEIRGISNIAGDPPDKWQKDLAAENCQRVVMRIVEVI